MNRSLKQAMLAILVTGLWVNISETVRWLYLIEPYWLEKYSQFNMTLPKENVNFFVWMIWGFLFSVVLYILTTKFSLLQTVIISWFVTFVMLWIVLWNLGVLPTGMLWINIPLSLFETYIGALICRGIIIQKN